MDSQTFRDMCAVYAMQAVASGSASAAATGRRNGVAIAMQAFDIAEAMLAERKRRDDARAR